MTRYTPDFIRQVRAQALVFPVPKVADDYNVPITTLRGWIRGYTRVEDPPLTGQLPYVSPSALAKAQAHAVQMRFTSDDCGGLVCVASVGVLADDR
jgi:hypothetical protein